MLAIGQKYRQCLFCAKHCCIWSYTHCTCNNQSLHPPTSGKRSWNCTLGGTVVNKTCIWQTDEKL